MEDIDKIHESIKSYREGRDDTKEDFLILLSAELEALKLLPRASESLGPISGAISMLEHLIRRIRQE